MAIPANRYKLLPLRGLKANLDAGIADILEGEICYATDEDQYYQKENSALVSVGATKDQGALADSSMQPGDNISDLNNDAGYITAGDVSEAPVQSVAGKTGDVTLVKADITDLDETDYATAAQGSKADSSVQPGDNVSDLNNDAGYITLAEVPDSGVLSVNGDVGPNVVLVKADIGLGNVNNTSDANKPISNATQTALNAKADLIGGVIPTNQIPAIAVTEFLGDVASEAAMLALVGQKGDWCNRTDAGLSFVITGEDPSLLTSWTDLVYPAAPVTSVNGQTGTVILNASDVGAISSDELPNLAPSTIDLQEVTDNGNTTTNSVYFGDDVEITNDLTVNGTITGTASNADKLDNLDSTQFVRSDANDTISGRITLSNTSGNPKLDFSGISAANQYNYIIRGQNDVGNRASHFINGSTRTSDGGANTYTIRNDGGSLRLGKSGFSTLIEGSGELTYNANTVWHAGNSSFDVSFDDLTRKGAGTGDYATTGYLIAGKSSGGVALTHNDGYGNANVTFNHRQGIPEQDGNSLRIEANTDSTSGAYLSFEGKSNVTANSATSVLTNLFTMTETGSTCLGYEVWHAGNMGSGSGS